MIPFYVGIVKQKQGSFFDFFMNFYVFLRFGQQKMPAPPQRVYQELSEKL